MTATADPKAEQRARAIANADARMVRAKSRFSLAALACMRNALDAEEQVRRALEEIDQARAGRGFSLTATRSSAAGSKPSRWWSSLRRKMITRGRGQHRVPTQRPSRLKKKTTTEEQTSAAAERCVSYLYLQRQAKRAISDAGPAQAPRAEHNVVQWQSS
jgi:hypothetical protein